MRIGVRWPLNGHSDWRSECSTVALTWLVLAVIVVMQALPFTYGYRRSADDLAFLAVLFGGRSLDEFAISAAVAQGRLGLLLTVPLNVLGTYLSGEYIARLSFVLMHFGVFALFAAYFSLISATNVTRALLIFLIALHPICRGTDHMPPTSYPAEHSALSRPAHRPLYNFHSATTGSRRPIFAVAGAGRVLGCHDHDGVRLSTGHCIARR